MNQINATIKWLTEQEGGRREIPIGFRYCPIIKIKGYEKTDVAWSIDFICANHHYNISRINFAFLSNDAPEDILISGKEFELYEGTRKVAYGTID